MWISTARPVGEIIRAQRIFATTSRSGMSKSRMARGGMAPPQGLIRPARSSSATRAPDRARSSAAVAPAGRAARNAEGLVILYADTVTPSMRSAMDETERRRKLQDDFNRAHGIVPRTIRKSVREMVEISHSAEEASKLSKKKLSDRERAETIARLEKEMKEASRMLEFEYAALLRDQIIELRGEK